MSKEKGIVTRASIQGIADGIRYANGSNTEYKPAEMEAAVRALKKTLVPKNITENGDYYPESGVDGFDEVHVNVSGGGGSSDLLSGIRWENGSISANYGSSYGTCKTSSSTRIRTDTLVRIDTQGTYYIDFDSELFDAVIDLFDSGCTMVNGGTGYNTYQTQPFSINITNRNVAFIVRKKSGANISPEEIDDVSLSIQMAT